MPEPLVRTTPATVHGRYLVELPAGAPAGLLVGFHGYGQNAGQFLDTLRRVPGAEHWVLVSVQALHPYYSRSRDVVASWMTSVDRELAITDNTRYVATVMTAVTGEFRLSRPLVYLGFSQGAAMAYRAAAGAGRPCDGLIVLAGDVPPDLRSDELAALPPLIIGRGTQDEWYTAGKEDADRARLLRAGAQPEFVVFDGGHEWTREFLRHAGRFLDRTAAGVRG